MSYSMQIESSTTHILVRSLSRREGLEVVRQFLHDLETHSLEVVLVPSKDPDWVERGWMVRAAERQNPAWYQDFCSQYTARRGTLSARCDWCRGWHKRNGRKKEARCLRRMHGPRRGRRLHDTAIKRRDTIRGLNELLEGKCHSVYAHRLRDFIRENWLKYDNRQLFT